ncbi:MAG: SDR family oxidoreductase [Acidilobaceae archaeon]|nr:SDR family oxidoreductase [Acidilobaceae archaeon]MCX8165301.1 SDR family oxidoreductase [Acidilobaceae archaeon]MDW7973727.1 SDR family oxidoreductase [Sulfolobales archaeon]
MACAGLVTGASSGIGYYAAEAVASLGCNLLTCAREEGRLARAAGELRERYGVDVRYMPCDLRRKEDAEALVGRALGLFGKLEYVVLSFGNPSREPLLLHEAAWEDWMEAFALYTASTATIMRELLLKNRAKASLVVISSFTTLEPMPPLVLADVARAGLSRLVRIAAREYPSKIRPLLLLIGSFDTPGARRTIERLARARGADPQKVWEEEVEGLSPLKRAGRKEELVRFLISLLKSPEYLSGATILFDGSSSRVAL